MHASLSVLRPRSSRTAPAGLLSVLLALFASPALADGPVVRVEEDWTMAIGEPDADTLAPQASTFMAPRADFAGVYFGTLLNHAAADGFQPGGFQVVAFSEDTAEQQATSLTRQPLNYPYEEIRWTQVMALGNDALAFAIKNGMSDSWGTFGGSETLLVVPANGLSDLSEYSAADSLAAAEVGFGGTRVLRMRLIEVRLYEADGTVRRYQIDQGPK